MIHITHPIPTQHFTAPGRIPGRERLYTLWIMCEGKRKRGMIKNVNEFCETSFSVLFFDGTEAEFTYVDINSKEFTIYVFHKNECINIPQVDDFNNFISPLLKK